MNELLIAPKQYWIECTLDEAKMYMDELVTFIDPIIAKLKPKVVGRNDME